MSYTDREQSASAGHPLELYRFSLGGEQWLFTSADHEVAHGPDLYQPGFIKRGGFTKGGDARKATLEIEVAASNPVALRFRTGWLATTLVLTIYRHHHEDADYAVLWKGRVTACKWSGSVATLTSDSVFTLFSRAGLRRVYQIGCPHVLFGAACGLNAASYAVAATASAVSGNAVAIPAISGYPGGYFVGGMLCFGGECRMLVASSGADILMVDMIADFASGSAVTLWPGCPRDTGTCASRFNNIANFGGLPFLPSKNPFGGDALV